jgi:hypothetical protein
MSSVLEELTQSNWKQLVPQVAHEIFPVGTLVDWHYAGWLEFGVVSSISETGKITIQRGKLPLEKVTDNENTGGTYGKFWFRADPEGFTPYTKEDLVKVCETPMTRFTPRYFYGADWKEMGYKSPIEFSQTKGSRLLILSKPEITEKDLIMEENYSS